MPKENKTAKERKELIEEIHDLTGYPRYNVEEVLRGFEQVMLERLSKGKVIKLWNFGKIETMPVSATRYWNKKTQRVEQSQPSITVKLRPSSLMLDKVNKGE